MPPLANLQSRSCCPRQGRSRCLANVYRNGLAIFNATCLLPYSAAAENPTHSSSVPDGLDNETLAAYKHSRRQLTLAAAVAAAVQCLTLHQPAAALARNTSSQKVDPQLLAAFQDALSAKTYEVTVTSSTLCKSMTEAHQCATCLCLQSYSFWHQAQNLGAGTLHSWVALYCTQQLHCATASTDKKVSAANCAFHVCKPC
jgi:hypothetical protein